jgi:hypothetical protein
VTTTPPSKEEHLPVQNNATANNPNPTLQSLEINLAQDLANSDLTTESSLEVETTEIVIQNSAKIEEPKSEDPSQSTTAEPETEPLDLKLVFV